MNVQLETLDDIAIVKATGNISIDETKLFQDILAPIVESSTSKGIIFDCLEVNYIDSSGLGTIVSIYKTLKGQDKKFVLININQHIENLLGLTKLDQIITIEEDLEAAIAGFK